MTKKEQTRIANTNKIVSQTNQHLLLLLKIAKNWEYGLITYREATQLIFTTSAAALKIIRNIAVSAKTGLIKSDYSVYLQCESLLECGTIEALQMIHFGEI